MPDFTPPPPLVDLSVSPRALAIAREIDRLSPGEWSLQITKHIQAEGGGMIVELKQETTFRVMEWK